MKLDKPTMAISELTELLETRNALNQDLINRNRELKAKLTTLLSIKSDLAEEELSLIIGLELLLLLKKRKYDLIREKEENWTLLYDAIHLLYGDISDIVSSLALTSQEMKVCYLTYIGISNSEQAEILIIETNTIKKYKNRIRNKLKLKEGTQLSVYLNLNSRKERER